MRHWKKIVAVGVLHVVILAVLWPLRALNDSPARRLYQEYCATCHGANLQGGMAQSLVNGVWQFGEGRNYIHSNIKFGLTHLGMPGYEGVLSDAQINQLTTFLLEAERSAEVTRRRSPRRRIRWIIPSTSKHGRRGWRCRGVLSFWTTKPR